MANTPDSMAEHPVEAAGTAGLDRVRLWRAYGIVVVVNLLVFTAFLWLATTGTWRNMPGKTLYYDWLATAFEHGHLAIEQTPPPALLVLSNPYDPAQRAGIPLPVDVSLYKGRYFIYFGPVPALLLLAAKPFTAAPIPDSYPVLA